MREQKLQKPLVFFSLRWKLLIGFTLLFSLVFAAAYYWFYLKRRGGWALRGADGKTLDELEAEGLAGGAESLMSAPP